MDDTTKKLFKELQSPAQQLLDVYDKTGVSTLQKELKRLEPPFKVVHELRETLNVGRDLHNQLAIKSPAIAQIQKNIQESVQFVHDLQSFKPAHNIQKLAEQLQPAPWLVEFHRSTTELTKQLAPALEALRNISEPIQRIAKELQQIAEPFRPLLKEILRMEKYRQRMEKAGWLPHTTMPLDKLEETEEENDAIMLEAYYRENWPEVKQAFLDSLHEQDVDDQAKAVFIQVLEAHGHGLYSLTARALFPEIERVARMELHHNEAMAVVTSQKTLREKAKNLNLGNFSLMGYWDYELYKALNHIYEYCNTVEHASAFAQMPVPNRHAAIHGHVVYDTLCSSMNALIVTDFIFRLITAIKRSETETSVPIAVST